MPEPEGGLRCPIVISSCPAHPDLEYYRKQAKHLQRTYATGDAAAQARVADVLGDRAAGRFLLSDAQFVLAQEHGIVPQTLWTSAACGRLDLVRACFAADGWLHVLYATRWHDPVTQQLHDLIESRSR